MPVNITAVPAQTITFQRQANPAAPGGFDLVLHVHYNIDTDHPRLNGQDELHRVLTGAQRTAAIDFLSQIQTEVNTLWGV